MFRRNGTRHYLSSIIIDVFADQIYLAGTKENLFIIIPHPEFFFQPNFVILIILFLKDGQTKM